MFECLCTRKLNTKTLTSFHCSLFTLLDQNTVYTGIVRYRTIKVSLIIISTQLTVLVPYTVAVTVFYTVITVYISIHSIHRNYHTNTILV